MKYFAFPAEFLLYIIGMKRCHTAQLALYRGTGMGQFVRSGRRLCSFFYHFGVWRFFHFVYHLVIEINVIRAFFIRMLYPSTDGRMAAPGLESDY